MNSILKLLETRDLYIHLILFKIYLQTSGRTKIPINESDLKNEIKEIFDGDYSYQDYLTATQYLISENLVENSFMGLTVKGRAYFENWIKEFENLSKEDQQKLNENLSPKISKFFELTDNIVKVGTFVTKLIELSNNI
ncbi:hypothetical protein KO500_03585 [Cellulophaga baltica]|uniref:hypothetical protein n=1 Tax=Cellulophaga TaxID=104264 RepID=UPI001C07985E|nr:MULTISPECIES: hypothetical protein [Cellulophaga]MBU2995495.1 hypothetical protein [Cellulophaga baltica]MDO6766889.1 hypothetical protein [Cellulophaga sp. 1_MG-2023]